MTSKPELQAVDGGRDALILEYIVSIVLDRQRMQLLDRRLSRAANDPFDGVVHGGADQPAPPRTDGQAV